MRRRPAEITGKPETVPPPLALTHPLAISPRFGPHPRALIVDSQASTRNVLASHLRALGFAEVLECAQAEEAARQVQACGFDLLLCEQQLAEGSLGQVLIEDLRRAKLLSLRTVVMLVSADASYDTVAEVAESAVDGFVIRPYSHGSLEDRLLAAFQRKSALSPVYDAIEAGRHAQALQLCERLHQRRAPHWTHAARLGAELALRLDRAALAWELFESVLAVRAVPWARLGLARALVQREAAATAGSTIENLLSPEPLYADAYDVLGRLQAEQGNLQAALQAYQTASRVTPGSVQRAQKYGILAFYAGEPELAYAALGRAMQLGGRRPGADGPAPAGAPAAAPLFDPQALLLLAFLQHRRRDADGLALSRQQLEALAQAQPAQPRLQRLLRVAQALESAMRGDVSQAQQCTAALAEQTTQPDFDTEAAGNLLSLLAALHRSGVAAQRDSGWVLALGLRFCTGRHSTEMLVQAAQGDSACVAGLRQAHTEIGEIAQAALSLALEGQPQAAVEQLLEQAERTGNAKLLLSAGATLSRYRARIVQADVLQQRCETLQQRRANALPAGPTGLTDADEQAAQTLFGSA